MGLSKIIRSRMGGSQTMLSKTICLTDEYSLQYVHTSHGAGSCFEHVAVATNFMKTLLAALH